MYDVFIRTATLPSAVKAVVVPNDDGTYDIYVNEVLSADAQLDAIQHELCHIKESHFENDEPVIIGEIEANHSEKTRCSLPDLCHSNGAIGRVV